MFGFPVLLAVLALAGAPSSTPVTCNPNIVYAPNPSLGPAPGVTYWNGTIPVRSELGTLACGALAYAGSTPQERKKIRALNLGVNFDQLLGVGLQVALHESNHVALRSRDECLVEKTTRTEINGLIEKYADPKHAASAELYATVSDSQLPAIYHGC